MQKFGVIFALWLVSHAYAGSFASVLPNDLLQGESAEVSAAPADLHSCVIASVSGIDGISTQDVGDDDGMTGVVFKTSMPRVIGQVQRRSGGRVWVFIGILSKEDEPAVRAFAAPRVNSRSACGRRRESRMGNPCCCDESAVAVQSPRAAGAGSLGRGACNVAPLTTVVGQNRAFADDRFGDVRHAGLRLLLRLLATPQFCARHRTLEPPRY